MSAAATGTPGGGAAGEVELIATPSAPVTAAAEAQTPAPASQLSVASEPAQSPAGPPPQAVAVHLSQASLPAPTPSLPALVGLHPADAADVSVSVLPSSSVTPVQVHPVRATAASESTPAPPPPQRHKSKGSAFALGVANVANVVASVADGSIGAGWSIHPDSLLFQWWLSLFVLVIFANVWSVPFRLSIGYLRIQGDFTAYNVTDALFDLVYLCHIAVKTRLAYWAKDGALVTHPKRIWQRYKRSPDMLVDVVSVLPIDWFLLAAGHYRQCVFTRLLRLLQFFFVARYIQNLEKSPGVNVTVVRLGKILSYYLLLSHLVGCAWFSFALPDKFGSDPWLPSLEILDHPLMSQYLRVLYYGLATLSDRIEAPNPYYSSGAMTFMIMTQVLGVLLLAYVIGNIAFVIDDANETFQRFRLELDYVQRFMTKVRLPRPLQERVREYYYFTWKRNRGFNDLSMLKDLPSSLRTDVCLQLTASTVGSNPLFQGLDASFLHALVKELQQRTLAPGEFLCVQGDVGTELFFIRQGVVAITVTVEEDEEAAVGADAVEGGSDKDAAAVEAGTPRPRGVPQQRQVQTCVDGDLIGEFCVLLSEQCPVCTASAQAVSYVELYVLAQDSLALLLSYYPSVEEELQQRATKRRQMMLRKEKNIIGLGSPSSAVAAAATAPVAANGAGGRGSIGAKNDKMKQLLGGDTSSPLAASRKDVAQSSSVCGPAAPQWRDKLALLRIKVLRWLDTHWLSGTPFYEWWCRLIFVVSLWNALVVPYRLAFDFSAQAGAMLFFDYLFDLVLMVHCAGHFFLRQAPKMAGQKGTLLGAGAASGIHSSTALASASLSGDAGVHARFETFSQARWRYFRSGWLLWDLATCFPLDLFMLVHVEMNPWFRLGKVARFLTDMRVLSSEKLQNAGFNASAVGLVQLVTGALLTTHWASCLYQSFSASVGFGAENEWLPSAHWASIGRLDSYLWAQYQTLILLTGLGMKAPPQGDLEILYVLFMILLGILIVAWAVGEIGELIANGDRFAAEFGRQLLATGEFMHYRHFEPKVQQRVRNYLGHCWSTRHGADPHVAMAGLPDGLRAEIMHHLCAGVLVKVPLFARLIASEGGLASSSFARHLIARLRFDSYPAGEFVFHAGDVGDSMYIITEGALALVVPPEQKKGSPQDHRRSVGSVAASSMTISGTSSLHTAAEPLGAGPSKILGPGSFFGEVSLLLTNGLRTASVRALKPTFLLVLQKDALYQLMGAHPQFKAELTRVGAERAAKIPFLRERGEKLARTQRARARVKNKEQRRRRIRLGRSAAYESSSSSSSSSDDDSQRFGETDDEDLFDGLAEQADMFDANDADLTVSPALNLGAANSGPVAQVAAAGPIAAASGAQAGKASGSEDDVRIDISRSQGDLHTYTRDHDEAYARFMRQLEKDAAQRATEEEADGADVDGVDAAIAAVTEASLAPQEQQRRAQIVRTARDAAARLDMTPAERAAAEGEPLTSDDEDDGASPMLLQVRDSRATSNADALRRAGDEDEEEKHSTPSRSAVSSSRPAVRAPLGLLRIPSASTAPSVRRLSDAEAGTITVLAPSNSADTGAVDARTEDAVYPTKSAGIETPLAAVTTVGSTVFAPSPAAAKARQQPHQRLPSLHRSLSSRAGGAPVLSPRRNVLRALERQNTMTLLDTAAAGDGANEERGVHDVVPTPRSILLRRAPSSPIGARGGGGEIVSVPSSASSIQASFGGANGLLGLSIPPSPAGLGSDSHGLHDGSGALSLQSPVFGHNTAALFARPNHGVPTLGRQPSLTSMEAAAVARSVSNYPPSAIGGDSDRPVVSRPRTLERRTDSGVAPMSVFAQARLLHASRTIETAVRNGVLRSEAQVADVMQAVEAQLEHAEHERQEASAARNMLPDAPAAAASERSRTRVKHSPHFTGVLAHTMRGSPGMGPSLEKTASVGAALAIDPLCLAPAVLHGSHARSRSASVIPHAPVVAAATAMAPALAIAPPATDASASLNPLSLGIHLVTPAQRTHRRLDSVSKAAAAAAPVLAEVPDAAPAHATLLPDRGDSASSPGSSVRAWPQTDDPSPTEQQAAGEVDAPAAASPARDAAAFAAAAVAPAAATATAPAASDGSTGGENDSSSPLLRSASRVQIHPVPASSEHSRQKGQAAPPPPDPADVEPMPE